MLHKRCPGHNSRKQKGLNKMGRKLRKNLSKKNSAKSSPRPLSEKVPCPYSFAETSPTISFECIKSLHFEISNALQEIFDSYFCYFSARKESRLSSPLCSTPYCKTLIETHYRNELTQKIKQLVHYENFYSIYTIFHDHLKEFLRRVCCIINELTELGICRETQLLVISDAFDTVENSGEELTKITQGIFQHRPSLTCEDVVKRAFYEKVLKPFEGLLQEAEEKGQLTGHLGKFQTVALELGPRRVFQGGSDHSFDSDDVDIDSIVDFIEGGAPHTRKTRNRFSKASTAETSLSPLNMSLDDSIEREIREFEKRLSTDGPSKRLQPKLSDDWISRLRSLINKGTLRS